METEKQLLTNLFINEVLFLTDLNSIFESDDTFKNLSIEEKILKQGLKLNILLLLKEENHLK